ncbi:MAG: hypothetical protein H7Z11_24215 [Verrucomicrobia bacterium]|nr:hypothetical protein [Leptolyngbya sp. ES-bin-22]
MGFSSKHELTAEATPHLKPYQIVCMEHETSYLYAEVIQVIEIRRLCWARPLMLVMRAEETLTCDGTVCEPSDWYDLRQDSDLLLPLVLFRVALDTEVFSWIANLYADDCETVESSNHYQSGHQRFRQFVQDVWQAHPDAFQNPPG